MTTSTDSVVTPPSDERAAPSGPQAVSPVGFIALTFIVTWTLWGAAAVVPHYESWGIGARALLFLPGTFAPALVALGLTARAEGQHGVQALLSRLFLWEVGARWYLFAVGYMATVKLTAALGYRVITGGWPAFGPVPWYLMLAAVAFSTAFQAGEEIGWRGLALPRLASRLGLVSASVLLGVVWALWHLPLFYISGTDLTGQPFLLFLLSVTALSVAMAWLYAHTRASLLLVMIMHAAVNNTTGIVPSAPAGGTNPRRPAPRSWPGSRWQSCGSVRSTSSSGCRSGEGGRVPSRTCLMTRSAAAGYALSEAPIRAGRRTGRDDD